MFKKRIAFQLTAGFVVIVLISMLTIGVFFIQMFRQYAFDSRKQILLTRAHTISEMLGGSQSNVQMRGMGSLMRFLDTLAEAKVWITDNQGNLTLVSSMSMSMGQGHQYNSEPLPKEANKVIQDVLSGQESVSESFSSVYEEATLTVGVPIVSAQNQILGGVFLHAPVTGVTETINKASSILALSLLAALLLAAGLGIGYSHFFTRPLHAMNRTALEMAQGNYTVKTGVNRQDELGQLGNSLDLLAARLDDTINQLFHQEQLRRDFVANVSHEFRTPLTIIRGSLEALVDGTIEGNQDIRRYHLRMLSETRGLERLVGDLLDLSRLQSGKITITIEEIHLPTLISDTIKSLQTLADKKEIKIHYQYEEDLPPLLGDYDRLRQMFVIFLDNAVKYSPEYTSVSVEAKLSGPNTIFITIRDQGQGISSDQLPYIWDRFYKGDTSRKGNGTGLGLAIAKHLIELHHGTVAVQSQPGKGTIIEIKLPLAPYQKSHWST